jgi:hypothetical protein
MTYWQKVIDGGFQPPASGGEPMILARRDAVLQRLADVLALVSPMAS